MSSFLRVFYRKYISKPKQRPVNMYEETPKELWKLEETVQARQHQTGLVPFNTLINKLLSGIKQAELNDDFGNNLKQPYLNSYISEVPVFLANLTMLRNNLLDFYTINSTFQSELKKKPNQDKEIIQKWIVENKDLIAQVLKDLNVINKKRTWPAYLVDTAWEAADVIVMTCAAVGLAALIIHLAGPSIFAGAFAHYIAPSAAAPLIEGTAAAVTVASTCIYKLFHTDEKQLESAIYDNLEHTIKISKGGRH